MSILRFLATGALAWSLVACDLGSATGVEPEPGPALVSLTVATPSLPADGRAVTVVRAVIPAESRVLPRQVTFSTTAGAFAPGTADSMRATVTADENGVAVALLRAPAAPTLALVRAQAGGTTLQDSARFTPAPADLALLTLSADSAAADTVTTILVRAVIPRTSTLAQRSVTFRTTLGRFDDDGSVTVEADSAGVATALLRAPGAPGLALVTAAAGNTVLQDTIRFYRAPPDLLALTLAADSLAADGASTMLVRATVRRGTARTPRSVTFSASSGTFGGGTNEITVPVDSSGTATALLRAPADPTQAVVRATAGNASLDTVIRFVRALPETVVLSADSFRVPAGAGSTLRVTAALRRSIGTVSPGATVHFSALRPDGTAIGWFAAETVSNTSGVVTATFTPGETDYRGPVRIVAAMQRPGGGMVQAEMTIIIADPS
ncbi:MAG: hypothetical protein KY467_02915 [Gemmatimonadetes bacterium]|nr:hypothetical protein [Gemmatimonadota bacterium]